MVFLMTGPYICNGDVPKMTPPMRALMTPFRLLHCANYITINTYMGTCNAIGMVLLMTGPYIHEITHFDEFWSNFDKKQHFLWKSKKSPKNSCFWQNFSKFQSHIPHVFSRNPGTPPGKVKNHEKVTKLTSKKWFFRTKSCICWSHQQMAVPFNF